MTDYLPTAVRAWIERNNSGIENEEGSAKRKPADWRPEYLLVFDTETTTDAAQQLNFGSYRYFRVSWRTEGPTLSCVEEGLFYGGDLAARDPEGLARLIDYAEEHPADVAPGFPGRLRLLSRREFAQLFHEEAYRKRTTVVAFNFPFDVSRLAVRWGRARFSFEGGHSLGLFDYFDGAGWVENRYRPRVAVKTIDSKRALKGFTDRAAADDVDRIPEDGAEPDGHYIFRGHFLDLRTLAFALTDESHSLESACRVFGVEHGKRRAERHGEITEDYIDYNRRDVKATAELYVKLMEEYVRHPIDLQPTKAYSPASIGKAYLRAMGIRPILERQPDFPREVLGYAMTAYFGGRAECRIRNTPVPVVYLDFLSMYPTVNALMGLWRFHTAERIEVREQTEEIRRLVETLALDSCFDPPTWESLNALVLIDPDDDILPVRARYESGREGWQIGVNPLRGQPRWYALADVVAAKVLSGRTPTILRALVLEPTGTLDGLRPVRLRGETLVDPSHDLFRTVVEERKRTALRLDLGAVERDRLARFLKVFANATSYGIFAEMNRRELPIGRREPVEVFGIDDPFPADVGAPETPGEFCFPPIPTWIAAGARLMLAMLERCVADLGGTYASCDTDSMGVVATELGGLVACPGGPFRTPDDEGAIQALTWDELEAIRERFVTLNPYDQEAVPGSILKLEAENLDPGSGERRQLWCYAISAKRNALFNLDDDGGPLLRKWSEHGLGHLLNPVDPEDEDRDWIRRCWEIIIGEGLGCPMPEPSWLDRPAISRITASTPNILHPFADYNRARRPEGRIRPFNFLLSAHVAPFGHPEGIDPARFHLLAPWSADPADWLDLTWFDLYSGRRFVVTVEDDLGSSGAAVLKTYRGVLDSYGVHPEAKSLGPDGAPCTRKTRGLLRRRPVVADPALTAYVGKESNRLEEVDAGIVHELGDVVSQYPDPRLDPFVFLVLPVLQDAPKAVLAAAAGVHPRTVAAVRNGRQRPRGGTAARLLRAAAAFARSKLRPLGIPSSVDDLAACRAYLDERDRHEGLDE